MRSVANVPLRERLQSAHISLRSRARGFTLLELLVVIARRHGRTVKFFVSTGSRSIAHIEPLLPDHMK